jgi:hypothetical protein
VSDTPTIPSHAHGCECDLCEDMPRFSKQAESVACKAARISPLARAALDNGVSFEDVEAYICAAPCKPVLGFGDVRGEFVVTAGDAYANESLDVALRESWLAQLDGSIAALRLWWRGVLP